MIFAKLDVCFDVHPKFVQLAMADLHGMATCAYWCAVLTHLRRNDSVDGYIPVTEIGLPLHVGNEAARKFCDRLVDAGLFERQEGGYLLLRYALKNETREDIEARLDSGRKRIAKHRRKVAEAKRNGADVVTHGVTPPVTGQDVTPLHVTRKASVTCNGLQRVTPGSDSDSVSLDLVSSSEPSDPDPPVEAIAAVAGPEESQTRMRAVPAVRPIAKVGSEPPPSLPAERVVRLGDALPRELRAAAEIIGVHDIDRAWLKFLGNHADQIVHVSGRWQSFCASWSANEAKSRVRHANGDGRFRPQAAAVGDNGWKPGDSERPIEEIPDK